MKRKGCRAGSPGLEGTRRATGDSNEEKQDAGLRNLQHNGRTQKSPGERVFLYDGEGANVI